jgi:bifunctional enzyme CysN/CysC
MKKEQMTIVVLGHVDHGKSTVIGRMLADSNSLPEGKLEKIKKQCEENARPFEYAFLLDALQNEQSQGITIDAARCFFNTKKRDYIIFDAPGHIEFLKNMISGASHAEAAVLIIDAEEGVKENSCRHGYIASLLGISQLIVVINKMDLIDYNQKIYDNIVSEYTDFLNKINLNPRAFIPVSARDGINIAAKGGEMKWYKQNDLLTEIDNFIKESKNYEKSFRFPVQDIYKFTEDNDNRRIFAGNIETGQISKGDNVIFYPSGKKSSIKNIEDLNSTGLSSAKAGEAAGFTFNTEIYIKPGEVMCKENEQIPYSGTSCKVNIFWMGHSPMIKNKTYKLKINSLKTSVYLKKIINILDATDLSTESNKNQIDRHDVAECIIETIKPFSFDIASEIKQCSRFVIVDEYEIAGGGIIIDSDKSKSSFLNEYIAQRTKNWSNSSITAIQRANRFNQKPKFIIVTGDDVTNNELIASTLEGALFKDGQNVYYLGVSNISSGIDFELKTSSGNREEQIRRLGELGYMFTSAGLIFISSITNLDKYELDVLKQLNKPNELLVINIGEQQHLEEKNNILSIQPDNKPSETIKKIKKRLKESEILLEYYL